MTGADRAAFRAQLNAVLPRKRAIAQLLVRDHDGRVLLCLPTYKDDWDLPGGVVEPFEAPDVAAGRELTEELGLHLPVGRLLLTDWLPAWGGWDDALCLVFDGGEHDATLADGLTLQAREIKRAQFCTLDEAQERCADFTSRRLTAVVGALRHPEGGAYTHSGRSVLPG